MSQEATSVPVTWVDADSGDHIWDDCAWALIVPRIGELVFTSTGWGKVVGLSQMLMDANAANHHVQVLIKRNPFHDYASPEGS